MALLPPQAFDVTARDALQIFGNDHGFIPKIHAYSPHAFAMTLKLPLKATVSISSN